MLDDPDDEHHGLWRCFGCGERGNAAQLVAKLLGLTYREARGWLEARGLSRAAPIPQRVVVDVAPARPQGFAMPAGVVFGPFESWPESVRRYVASVQSLSRLEAWQVDRWGIGYGVRGKLAGRVVLPVRRVDGRLAAYSARTFVGDPVRYLEPREDEGADASALFGEQHWPAQGPDGRREGVLVVTEGALNGLAVERALRLCAAEFDGRKPYVGAVRGSHLSDVRLDHVASFPLVVVASDADDAGEKLHAELASKLRRWSRTRRVRFPRRVDAAALEATRGLDALADVLVDAC